MSHRPKIILIGLLLILGANFAFATEIALIGDKSKRAAFQQIAKEMKATPAKIAGVLRATSSDGKITFTVTESSDAPVAIANQLMTADAAFLVADSTKGPLPVVREQLLIARQAYVPRVTIYFTNTIQLQNAAPVDASELLELEVMEMRQLMDKYKMGGANATTLFDGDVSKIYKSEYVRGMSELRRYLASVTAKRAPQAATRLVAEFTCVYYLLGNPETVNRSVTLADQSDVEVWVEGSATTGTVKTASTHKPGSNGEFVLRLSSILKASEGSRVLLVKNGVTVGIGVVAKILR